LVDGEAPLALSKAVLGHLQGCSPCRAELESLRDLRDALQDLRDVAPVGLGARILAEARGSMAELARPSQAYTPLWARAAALLVGAACAAWIVTPRLPVTVSGVAEVRRPLGVVAFEAQRDLQLAGAFSADLRALAATPEGRLIRDIMEAAR